MKSFKYLFLTFLLAIACAGQTNLSGPVVVSGNTIIGGVGSLITLSSITVAPPNPVIPSNASQSFTASGLYSDGSSIDLTGLATWSSSNTAVATNSGPNFQCVARGNVAVIATYLSVQGTTTLGCQSPSFTPTGTVSVGQTDSSITIVQYTGFSGQTPYTFSSSDLPTGWTLSSTGCVLNQNDCSLVGTPSTVAVYNFHIQVTDGLGNTACSSPGCQVGVNVYAASSEDNQYCTLVGGVETVTGLTDPGPAQILQNCNYTAIASTPVGESSSSTISNIDDITSGWQICGYQPGPPPVFCAGGSGIGVPTQTFGNVTPSLDGGSMLVSVTGPALSNVEWYYDTGASDSTVAFTEDEWFYVPSTTNLQALEYDAFQYLHAGSGGQPTATELYFGTECVTGGSPADWDIWDQNLGHWVHTNQACSFNVGSWNHLVISVHRVPGDTSCSGGFPRMYYDSITVNGTTVVSGLSTCAGSLPPTYAEMTGITAQIDGNSNSCGGTCTNTEYIDEMNFTFTGQSSATVIYVCPSGELYNGAPITGCQSAIQPTMGSQVTPVVSCANGIAAPACGPAPYYSATIQGAVNYVFTNSGCGTDIQIYPTIDDFNPLSTQNIYTEPTVISPGSINCGPDYGQNWWYIRTKQYNNIPLPGNRISPAFVNQPSVLARPSYPPTTSYNIPTGTYMPMWRCEVTTSANCVSLSSQGTPNNGDVRTNGTTTVNWFSGPQFPTQTGCTPEVTPWVGFTITINSVPYTVACIVSKTVLTTTTPVPSSSGLGITCNCFPYVVVVNAVLSGLRVMGIEFTAPHGRDQSQDLYGNFACPAAGNLTVGLTQNCHPGFTGTMIYLGCQLLNSGATDCSATSPVQGNPLETPTGTGGMHNILDRVIVSPCDDISFATCFDEGEQGISLADGQHLSVIDSYVVGFLCHFAIGLCVEAHASGAGNSQELLNDIGTKEVNNYFEASGSNVFYGGGASGINIFPTDIEVRRNHLFKPLTEKVDSPYFSAGFVPGVGAVTGAIQDTYVQHNSYGSGYSTTPGAVTCTLDAPLNGSQAYCTPVVATTGPNAGGIVDVYVCNALPCTSSSPAGSGYGFLDKQGGFTYVAYPTFHFTDSTSHQTYSSCQIDLQGNVTLQNDPSIPNTIDIFWAHGNKFIPTVYNTQNPLAISVNGSNYFINGYISPTEITVPGQWTGTCPSGGCPYDIAFPSRKDCWRVIMPLANVKNLSEFKQGIRALWEGNHHEQVWEGASDQQGFGFLVTPKNANNLCPTCQVTDLIFRYNLFDRSTHGIQVAAAAATQGGTLSLYLTRISMHDNVFDGMNAIAWTEGLAAVSAGAGTCIDLENVQSQPYQTSFILFDHNTCVATLPNGAISAAGSSASLLALFYNVKTNASALMNNITVTNNIGLGGVKNNSSHSSGNVNCLNQSCTDQTGSNGHGPSEVSLRQTIVNSFEDTGSGCAIANGQYVCNQLTSVILNNNNSNSTATCATKVGTVALTPNDTGTGGSIAFSWVQQSPGPLFYLKMWVVNVGQGYTVPPTVTFSGFNCTTPPSATVLIAGANNPSTASGCFDHNVSATAVWPTEIAMIPYPTAQIDPTNNNCVSTAGGGNLSPATWYPKTIVGNTTCNPTNASALYFVNLPLDPTCQEAISPGFDTQLGDLHLSWPSTCPTSGACSPGHDASNIGDDIGAHIDLVMGCNGFSTSCPAGTPSQYTGCSINAQGVTTCPW